jgi:hypothetical protein
MSNSANVKDFLIVESYFEFVQLIPKIRQVKACAKKAGFRA